MQANRRETWQDKTSVFTCLHVYGACKIKNRLKQIANSMSCVQCTFHFAPGGGRGGGASSQIGSDTNIGCRMRILSRSALLESSIAWFREDDLLHCFRWYNSETGILRILQECLIKQKKMVSFGKGLMNPPLSKKLRKSASSRFPHTNALTATSATRYSQIISWYQKSWLRWLQTNLWLLLAPTDQYLDN